MTDLLEDELRGVLAEQAARITPQASARLRAVEYRPRARWRPRRRVLGAVGLSGAAAAAATAIFLGSSAAPAFAGWTASPTTPQQGQLTAAEQNCGGTPVLTDTRGPYTVAVYANGSTCMVGKGVYIKSTRAGGGTPTASAGTIQLNGAGERDSAGNALTMVDGPIGSGVTGVTITRSDGSSVQATVENGWYLAWWPGTQHAVTASVMTTSGTETQSFPHAPNQSAPTCPPGAHCSSAYGFGAAPGHGSSQTSVTGGGSAGQ